jgi:ribosome maturation factor RimP
MASYEDLKADLLALVQPVFDAAGVDLIELNVRRQGRDFVIEILADRPSGGISMEECSFLNRKVVDLIDAEAAITEGYTLELSSPGLDRPLKTRKDFLRVMHQEIRFHLTGPTGGKLEYSGILKEVKENAVMIETQKHGEITIPIANISKAMQVF